MQIKLVPKLISLEFMFLGVKIMVDNIENREKDLGLLRQFETLHSSFPPSPRLMGVFRPIVQILASSMLQRWQ
jgi:hypothetical protein